MNNDYELELLIQRMNELEQEVEEVKETIIKNTEDIKTNEKGLIQMEHRLEIVGLEIQGLRKDLIEQGRSIERRLDTHTQEHNGQVESNKVIIGGVKLMIGLIIFLIGSILALVGIQAPLPF